MAYLDSTTGLTYASVVLMAVLRLWSGLEYNNRGVLMYDYTFWLPKVGIIVSEVSIIAYHAQVLIFSCLGKLGSLRIPNQC
jgi:hypothetical protein